MKYLTVKKASRINPYNYRKGAGFRNFLGNVREEVLPRLVKKKLLISTDFETGKWHLHLEDLTTISQLDYLVLDMSKFGPGESSSLGYKMAGFAFAIALELENEEEYNQALVDHMWQGVQDKNEEK